MLAAENSCRKLVIVGIGLFPVMNLCLHLHQTLNLITIRLKVKRVGKKINS